MKLSVIITCYNQKDVIKEAIDSVLNQKIKDEFEIILADDGSNDGSWEFILNEYSQYPNIRCIQIERKPNIKYTSHIRASQCRIAALQYVTGKYFAYLDGDDFYCNDTAMQKKIDILDKPENNDIILVASRFIVYKEGKFGITMGPDRLPEGRIQTKRYWKRYYISSNTCIFRSSIIPKIPYDIIGKVFHDNIILFTALQYGNMYYLKDIAMAYRQNSEKSSQHIWINNNKRTNDIRQVIDLDIANKLNKKLWKESYYRYHGSIRNLLKSKMEESDKELYELSKELSCRETLQILDWRSQKKLTQIYILSKHSLLLFYCQIQLLCRRVLLQTRLQKYIN